MVDCHVLLTTDALLVTDDETLSIASDFSGLETSTSNTRNWQEVFPDAELFKAIAASRNGRGDAFSSVDKCKSVSE